MSNFHTPVLLDTAIDYLNVQSGHKYIDATLGGGGHAQKIKSLGGLVLGLDQDEDAINNSRNLVDLCVKSNFIHLEEVVRNNHWFPVSGILLDLGMSMHQIEDSARGFSFQVDGPLDMRMDQGLSSNASDLINHFPFNHLAKIFKDFGEIPEAKTLASKIIKNRPITNTLLLASICGKWSQQAFQALRIAVNDELGALTQVIPQIKNILEPAGRAVIISFHSLEDRIVKDEFRDWGIALAKKPIAGERGSKLRAFEKI